MSISIEACCATWHMHMSPIAFMQIPPWRAHFDVVVACEDEKGEDIDVPLVSIKLRCASWQRVPFAQRICPGTYKHRALWAPASQILHLVLPTGDGV